jgi:hypothetical protein
MFDNNLEQRMPVAEPEGEKNKVAASPDLDAETLHRIGQDLANWETGSKIREFAEQSRQRWEAVVRPLEDAISASERLTEEDLAVRINIRD